MSSDDRSHDDSVPATDAQPLLLRAGAPPPIVVEPPGATLAVAARQEGKR